MANNFTAVRGQKVKGGHGLTRYRTCDRCGRGLTRDRSIRPDGLTLCIDCVGDRWYISAAAKTVKT
jgi:hypothetical protein